MANDFDITGLSFSDIGDLVEINQDNTRIILEAIDTQLQKGLEAVGLAAEGYAKALCPVDTGRLRNSITHQLDGDKAVYIGTNVEYAPYVEMGTSRQTEHPFLRPAAEGHSSEYSQIMKSAMSS